MRHAAIAISILLLSFSAISLAQKAAVDPSQRYFRIICLVHLTGSGAAGDPVVPEYVVQGTAVAQTAVLAAATTSATTVANPPAPGAAVRPASRPAAAATPGNPGTTASPAPMSSRPGILGWSMQKSDDGTMAIVQMVAADHHAFDSILADTRPEIRVFEIGKTPAATIQAEMQKYKQNFDLSSFRVMVQ